MERNFFHDFQWNIPPSFSIVIPYKLTEERYIYNKIIIANISNE